jgi:DNA uptake protein ComE-like DNA-binding protein
VPGIGPTRAAQIIAGRPYSSIDELSRISGIGATQVEDMRPFISAGGDTTKRPEQ